MPSWQSDLQKSLLARKAFAPKCLHDSASSGAPIALQKLETDMRIHAAVVEEKSGPFVIEEFDLDDPRPDEILVRIIASGI